MTPLRYLSTVYCDNGFAETPHGAQFDIDLATAKFIIEMAGIIKQRDLYCLEKFDYRVTWLRNDPNNSEEYDDESAADSAEKSDIRIECDTLVVTNNSFYFRGLLKYSSDNIETDNAPIKDLADYFGLDFCSASTSERRPSMATEFVICGRHKPDTFPTIWNFYPSQESAEEYVATHADALTKDYPAGFEIMPWGAYEAQKRTQYLAPPVIEIDHDRYWEMLEVLPPLKWETVDGVERFLMSEFETGPFTAQYAEFRGRYFTKTVDAFDRKTWIDRAMLEAFIAKE